MAVWRRNWWILSPGVREGLSGLRRLWLARDEAGPTRRCRGCWRLRKQREQKPWAMSMCEVSKKGSGWLLCREPRLDGVWGEWWEVAPETAWSSSAEPFRVSCRGFQISLRLCCQPRAGGKRERWEPRTRLLRQWKRKGSQEPKDSFLAQVTASHDWLETGLRDEGVGVLPRLGFGWRAGSFSCVQFTQHFLSASVLGHQMTEGPAWGFLMCKFFIALSRMCNIMLVSGRQRNDSLFVYNAKKVITAVSLVNICHHT